MTSCETAHRTFVHHMALDPSGSLLASCSSDKQVNIFHRSLVGAECSPWMLFCVIRDHVATVTRVAWCLDRQHGPLLATAGADRWIYLYNINITTQKGGIVANAVKWPPVKGFERDAITDVAFVPPRQHHALLLSTASLDGYVRLYDINQRQEFPCVYKITADSDSSEPLNIRRGGITSIAWFPSSADETMTLAVGCVNGSFFLYRFSKEKNDFEQLRNTLPERAEGPVEHILWAPPVGRLFQLLVICSRSSVHILRLNCVSPSLEEFDCEIFTWRRGAVCAAWTRSASLLYLVSDDEATEVSVLQANDPSNHQSWREVAQNTSGVV